VLGGDGIRTIDQVREALERHRPVVIVTGSSRVPTLLAELFYVLEDKVPRSLLHSASSDSAWRSQLRTNCLFIPHLLIYSWENNA